MCPVAGTGCHPPAPWGHPSARNGARVMGHHPAPTRASPSHRHRECLCGVARRDPHRRPRHRDRRPRRLTATPAGFGPDQGLPEDSLIRPVYDVLTHRGLRCLATSLGAPGRTRTCATGSGGRSGLSRPSCPFAPVLLNRPSGPSVHFRPLGSTHSIANSDCQDPPADAHLEARELPMYGSGDTPVTVFGRSLWDA